MRTNALQDAWRADLFLRTSPTAVLTRTPWSRSSPATPSRTSPRRPVIMSAAKRAEFGGYRATPMVPLAPADRMRTNPAPVAVDAISGG
ncbi:hypothetical protein N7U49_41665 [Streptomyces sp. AD2-2]|nr:hypothetical protein N7U49_41665 [Streptomyces sp. AD2-2]